MPSDQAFPILMQSGWLTTVEPDFRAAFMALAVRRTFGPDMTMILAGDANGGLWGIESGQMDLTSGLSTPNAPPLHISHAGTWWGPGPLFGRSRIATMTTRSDAVLAHVPQAAVLALLAENPVWWRELGKLVFEQAELGSWGLSDMLIRSSRRRCIAVLLRLSGCRHADAPHAPPYGFSLPQEAFAEMANVSRQTAGTVLRRLEEEGLIRLGYRGMTLLDAGALRRIVDGA